MRHLSPSGKRAQRGLYHSRYQQPDRCRIVLGGLHWVSCDIFDTSTIIIIISCTPKTSRGVDLMMFVRSSRRADAEYVTVATAPKYCRCPPLRRCQAQSSCPRNSRLRLVDGRHLIQKAVTAAHSIDQRAVHRGRNGGGHIPQKI